MTREIAARGILRDGRRAQRITVGLFVVLGIMAAIGCDGGTRVNKPPDESNLRGIVRVYGIATRDLGRPPKSMDELTAIYAQADPDPSKYVRSPRDGEELVVVWGLDLERQPADMVVAYERKGADGKRMVVTADNIVRDVTNDEFAKLKFPKDYKPES
jgi:hypothetical protein